MTGAPDHAAALDRVLAEIGPAAIAVSGGVDSTTLATAAHRRDPDGTLMIHAVSPAVPPEATARVRDLAAAEGWHLKVIDAGEFEDPDYLSNPVNRCFFCKSNLYGTMQRHTANTLLSGTNLDDLGDYRPGLDAAANHGVRHPYVEAGIDKAGVRALARHFGLDDVAELPAAPCLSSRIETGLPVTAETLTLVHRIETAVTGWLHAENVRPEAVRCRVRRDGLVVELDPVSLALAGSWSGVGLRARLGEITREAGVAGVPRLAAYKRGSAFLHDTETAEIA